MLTVCRLFISIILLTAVTATMAGAAEYYVAPSGDDTASGDLSNPWKTPQKAAQQAVAGDTIYLREGTYRIRESGGGPIVFANSGSDASSQITMRGYQNEAAIINGMLDRSDTSYWTLYKSDIYFTANLFGSEFDKDIQVVVQDDAALQLKSSLSSLTAQGQAYFDKATGTLYVRAIGGGNPGIHRLEVSQSDRLVEFFPGNQFIVLENLTLTGGYYGIQALPGGGNRTFRNLVFRHVKNDCIKFNTTANHDDLVEYCTFADYGDFGIDSYGSSNQTFRYNEFSGVHAWRGGGAIKTLAGANNIVIEGNHIHDLGGLGWEGALELRESQNITVINNLIVNTKGPGINIYGDNASLSTPVSDPTSRYITIANNTIYHTKLPGIWVSRASANITAANNIIYQLSGDSSNLRVEAGAEDGFWSDYNDFYRTSGYPVRWLSTNCTFLRYKQITKQDLHSLSKDPRFTNVTGRNFHLLESSPVIDRGTPMHAPALDMDRVSRPQGSAVDMGAYEYRPGY